MPYGTGSGSTGIINSGGRETDWVNIAHTAASFFLTSNSVSARSLQSGVDSLLRGLGARGRLRDVHFFGHGGPGAMYVGSDTITAASFQPGHAHYQHLVRLRERLAPGAVIHFAGCQTFAGEEGRAFAAAAARFFNRPVVGYTANIPPWNSQVRVNP